MIGYACVCVLILIIHNMYVCINKACTYFELFIYICRLQTILPEFLSFFFFQELWESSNICIKVGEPYSLSLSSILSSLHILV
jgi:hypothetical protein